MPQSPHPKPSLHSTFFVAQGIHGHHEDCKQKLIHLASHRKDTVLSQRNELEDLETKLRETDAKLKRLEARNRREQSQQIYSKRKAIASPTFVRSDNETEEDSSGDSDPQQGQSPPQRRGRREKIKLYKVWRPGCRLGSFDWRFSREWNLAGTRDCVVGIYSSVWLFGRLWTLYARIACWPQNMEDIPLLDTASKSTSMLYS